MFLEFIATYLYMDWYPMKHTRLITVNMGSYLSINCDFENKEEGYTVNHCRQALARHDFIGQFAHFETFLFRSKYKSTYFYFE